MELVILGECYKKLNGMQIDITIDGKQINLRFEKELLYHLAGFQYLYDYPDLGTSREKKSLMKKLCESEEFRKYIKKSIHYEGLKKRIYYFNMILQVLLEDYATIWANNKYFSRIDAEYVYVYPYRDMNKEIIYCYLFFRKDKHKDYYIPTSFFSNTKDKTINNSKGKSRSSIQIQKR